MRLSLLVILLLSVAAQASKLYRITGEVVGVGERTVSIRSGSEIFEFARSKHLGLPKRGERITILYHLDAEQISPAPEAGGTVPETPGVENGPLPSGLPGGPGVLDDRAFYNAKNSRHAPALDLALQLHDCDPTNRQFSLGRKQ